jgi:uncharacterized Zn-binding protein involved in type VI secretion
MPGLVRVGDLCTGHTGSYPPRPCIEGSSNVFINGRGVHRKGDAWDIHCNFWSCHGGRMAEGMPNVFINGIPAAFVGGLISCGSRVAQGSGNVFGGG